MRTAENSTYPLLELPGMIPETGGGDKNRTCDILLAKQTLFQLSYTPICDARSRQNLISRQGAVALIVERASQMVAGGGFEPPGSFDTRL